MEFALNYMSMFSSGVRVQSGRTAGAVSVVWGTLFSAYHFKYKCLEVYRLANIKSAKKRIEVAKKRNERNKSAKSAVKTASRKVEAAVAANDKAAAQAALTAAVSLIDKTAKKGIYHKNTAARKVSRLTKAVNTLA